MMLKFHKVDETLDYGKLAAVLGEIVAEREHQIAKHGNQTMPPPHWMVVLNEETGEANRAICEDQPHQYRAELVQAATVIVAMILDHDKRGHLYG